MQVAQTRRELIQPDIECFQARRGFYRKGDNHQIWQFGICNLSLLRSGALGTAAAGFTQR